MGRGRARRGDERKGGAGAQRHRAGRDLPVRVRARRHWRRARLGGGPLAREGPGEAGPSAAEEVGAEEERDAAARKRVALNSAGQDHFGRARRSWIGRTSLEADRDRPGGDREWLEHAGRDRTECVGTERGGIVQGAIRRCGIGMSKDRGRQDQVEHDLARRDRAGRPSRRDAGSGGGREIRRGGRAGWAVRSGESSSALGVELGPARSSPGRCFGSADGVRAVDWKLDETGRRGHLSPAAAAAGAGAGARRRHDV